MNGVGDGKCSGNDLQASGGVRWQVVAHEQSGQNAEYTAALHGLIHAAHATVPQWGRNAPAARLPKRKLGAGSEMNRV